MKTADWYIPWTYRVRPGLGDPAFDNGFRVQMRNGAGQLAGERDGFSSPEDAQAWADEHARARAEDFGAICDAPA